MRDAKRCVPKASGQIVGHSVGGRIPSLNIRYCPDGA
jgi:hypothetical protein